MRRVRMAAAIFCVLASPVVRSAQLKARAEEPTAGSGSVTVAELTQIVGRVRGKPDGEAANKIEHLELTERLSSSRLTGLSAVLPGSKSRAALMTVGDASVFLDPPAEDIPQKAAPDLAAQRRVMSRAVEYLRTVLPKLPNFYARRVTNSFEEMWKPEKEKGPPHRDFLHPAGQFRATVYYREGKEVVHEEGAQDHGLVTRGTFGPILTTVILDAARSGTTEWSRWEVGTNGVMAVFRFRVPREESHYEVFGSGELDIMQATTYHGEIGIDPDSGAILRLVLQADPLGGSMERADIMVEYGPVEIGGRMYTCPVRSVAYSVGAVDAPSELGVWKREAARLNDVVFSDYHVFRSEMRILP